MEKEGILDEDDAARTLVDRTKALFGSRTGEPISDEEAKSMIKITAAFFSLLNEWEASREVPVSQGAGESRIRNQDQGWQL
jgi:hypothetical protein